MKRMSPFTRNINRLEEHMKNVGVYLAARTQTNTLSAEDVDAMREFINIVGNNFNFACKTEPWWNKELFSVISSEIVDLIESMRDGCKDMTEDILQAKLAKTETIINALDDDIKIEIKAAIEESYPSLMVLFPHDRIAC